MYKANSLMAWVKKTQGSWWEKRNGSWWEKHNNFGRKNTAAFVGKITVLREKHNNFGGKKHNSLNLLFTGVYCDLPFLSTCRLCPACSLMFYALP
jgi:hypothetical protein